MSEYQYYEFVAVDGAISDEGLKYARSCSSRAKVSRTRWLNTYTFGDFRGSVDTLLKYYDAHFYLADWGTVRLGLALPKDLIPRPTLQPYLDGPGRNEPTLSCKVSGDRCIVWWEREDEEPSSSLWIDEEEEGAIIDPFIGIREELVRGDLRGVFLGWLADFDPEDWQDPKDGTALVPPIPAGLRELSPALQALLQYFPVDPDALAIAAELSPVSTQARIPIAQVLDGLSAPELRALLARVAEGGGQGVMAQLNRLTMPLASGQAGPSIPCTVFAARVLEARSIREMQKTKAAAAARQRKAELRQQHLTSVLGRADAVWSGLGPLMNQRASSAYDQVAHQLEELRDAYSQAGDSARFDQKLNEFRDRYSNRPAMLRRIEKL